jgi:deoxyribodipyrimidine photo-lyase
MTSARRRGHNFGLQRAAEWSLEFDRPILVVEALRIDYPHACERFHRFVIDGMSDNLQAFSDGRASYLPYVEPSPGAGAGLLETLAESACVVICDEYPCFFLPRMIGSFATRVGVRVETVDSNGLLPLRSSDAVWKTAFSFRRHVQKTLPGHLSSAPAADPLVDLPVRSPVELSSTIADRWPDATERLALSDPLAGLAVGGQIAASGTRGGSRAGTRALSAFIDDGLDAYGTDRNHPDLDGVSRLSPYLHFGHVGAHQVFRAVTEREGWSPDRLAPVAKGTRTGWWGIGEAAEGFLDQLVTWRELGYQCADRLGDAYASYESLPDWARETLEAHASDTRPHLYSLDELQEGRTSDTLWNAAQNQLRAEGRIHNYLRMLWGKRILEWTEHPRDAFDTMVLLNDRWALDGRDPNSYTGIGWVLGRHDRAWGPERPIFGKVRYMSSANTLRKLRTRSYMSRYSNEAAT